VKFESQCGLARHDIPGRSEKGVWIVEVRDQVAKNATVNR